MELLRKSHRRHTPTVLAETTEETQLWHWSSLEGKTGRREYMLEVGSRKHLYTMRLSSQEAEDFAAFVKEVHDRDMKEDAKAAVDAVTTRRI